MTKKDFELIAGIIKAIEDDKTRMQMAHHVASEFSKRFPNFDQVRFYWACMVDPEMEKLPKIITSKGK